MLEVYWRKDLVGYLWESAEGYAFAFSDPLPKSFDRRVMPEFSSDSVVFRKPTLFKVFANRIPPKSRPDREEILLRWGVEDFDDVFEILAKSKSFTSPLELRVRE